MIRLKVLGVALLATLAITAVFGLSTASASRFVSSATPAEIKGNGEVAFVFSGGRTYYCGMSFAAVTEGPTTELSPYSQSVSTCVYYFLGENKATLKTNGCVLSYHSGSATEGGYAGGLDIGPEGCGPMVMEDPKTCNREIPSQNGEGGVEYTATKGTNGQAAVNIGIDFGQLKYIQESKSGVCTGGTFTGGMSGDILTQAKNEAGQFVDFSVTDKVGVYLGPNGFEAEEYPANVTGAQDPGNQYFLDYAGRTVKCATGSFSGVLTGASTTLAVDGSASNCTWTVVGNKVFATVFMNGCDHVLNSSGQFAIACPEGKSIEIKGYLNKEKQESGNADCTYKIGSQTGVGGASYGTVGAGLARGVSVGINTTALTVTAAGWSEMLCGKASGVSAKFTVGTTLYGVLP